MRDEKGQKMSKSKGNVIDPLEMIKIYGTDALRFTLVALCAQGRDIKLSPARIEGYRHFINKIWNAGRYVLMNLEGISERELELLKDNSLSLFSKWILNRLDQTITKVREKLEEFEFDQSALLLYHFFWDDFCDWYIEISKIYLKDEFRKKETQTVLYYVFSESLKLLHPFIPFITEELWQYLPSNSKKFLIQESYPQARNFVLSEEEKFLVDLIMELIVSIRNIKAEYRLVSQKRIPIYYKNERKILNLIEQEKEIVKFLAKIDDIIFVEDYTRKKETLFKFSLQVSFILISLIILTIGKKEKDCSKRKHSLKKR